jgi:hypothetical protein
MMVAFRSDPASMAYNSSVPPTPDGHKSRNCEFFCFCVITLCHVCETEDDWHMSTCLPV